MKKLLSSIVLGASITALGAGCAVGSTEDDVSETEADARQDKGSIDDLPFVGVNDRYCSDAFSCKQKGRAVILPEINAGALYHSSIVYFPPNDVSEESATSYDQEILSVDPKYLKEVYAAAATTFAQCLVDEGMHFYGAWWCGPCKIQEAIFGPAWPIIKQNYTPCAAPGEEGISQECIEKQVYGIPHAQLDGTAYEGWLFLHQFEEKFPALPCHYDGPKIPNTGSLHKYVD